MKMIKLSLPILALTGLALAGCPGDDTPSTGTDTEGDDTTTTSTTTTTTIDPDSGSTTVVDPTGVDPTGVDPTGTDPTGEEDPYQFNDTPFGDYTQLDRQGFPAVNSGLNFGDKDAYNQGSPADDASLAFVTNVVEALETLHLGAPGMQTADNTGLDDDLLALGFMPCVTPPLPMDTCDDQGAPFVIPDVIEIDLSITDPMMNTFPNGRPLDFPVMDVILAVILLDLNTHPLDAFIDIFQDGTFVSLNPLQNDVPFEADFPYLAPAQ